MNKRKFFLNKLDDFLRQNGDYDLTEINVQKNQEVVLSEFYIIVKGEVEVFITKDGGKHIKLGDFSENDCFIGGLMYLYEHFDRHNVTAFFICKSNVVLKKIPQDAVDKIVVTPNINRVLYKIILERISGIGNDLISYDFAQNYELIKILLEKEADILNVVEIDNMLDFVDKYNVSRSTFYRGIKKLEEDEKIKKDGKRIIIVK